MILIYYKNSTANVNQTQVMSCSKNADCDEKLLCLLGVCYDPCSLGCGESALCSVDNHSYTCQCPSGFTGNPKSKCIPLSISNTNNTDEITTENIINTTLKPKEFKDISDSYNNSTPFYYDISDDNETTTYTSLAQDLKTNSPVLTTINSITETQTISQDIYQAGIVNQYTINSGKTTMKQNDKDIETTTYSDDKFTTKSSVGTTKKYDDKLTTSQSNDEDFSTTQRSKLTTNSQGIETTTYFDDKFTTKSSVDTTNKYDDKLTTPQSNDGDFSTTQGSKLTTIGQGIETTTYSDNKFTTKSSVDATNKYDDKLTTSQSNDGDFSTTQGSKLTTIGQGIETTTYSDDKFTTKSSVDAKNKYDDKLTTSQSNDVDTLIKSDGKLTTPLTLSVFNEITTKSSAVISMTTDGKIVFPESVNDGFSSTLKPNITKNSTTVVPSFDELVTEIVQNNTKDVTKVHSQITEKPLNIELDKTTINYDEDLTSTISSYSKSKSISSDRTTRPMEFDTTESYTTTEFSDPSQTSYPKGGPPKQDRKTTEQENDKMNNIDGKSNTTTANPTTYKSVSIGYEQTTVSMLGELEEAIKETEYLQNPGEEYQTQKTTKSSTTERSSESTTNFNENSFTTKSKTIEPDFVTKIYYTTVDETTENMDIIINSLHKETATSKNISSSKSTTTTIDYNEYTTPAYQFTTNTQLNESTTIYDNEYLLNNDKTVTYADVTTEPSNNKTTTYVKNTSKTTSETTTLDYSTTIEDNDYLESTTILSVCQTNDDCEQSYLCIRNNCENPCLTYNPCPLNVSCVVVNKTVTCLCFEAGLAHNVDCHVYPGPGNENYVKL